MKLLSILFISISVALASAQSPISYDKNGNECTVGMSMPIQLAMSSLLTTSIHSWVGMFQWQQLLQQELRSWIV